MDEADELPEAALAEDSQRPTSHLPHVAVVQAVRRHARKSGGTTSRVTRLDGADDGAVACRATRAESGSRMNWKTLSVTYDGPILRVWLDRPEKRNALNGDALEEIATLFNGLATDF